MPGGSAARRYEFRVVGPAPEDVAAAFPELVALMMGSQTVFYGDVIDEAHLFGLLARFRRLNLLVLEMRPLPLSLRASGARSCAGRGG
ncbi:hypothetical protein [Streptomyces longisporus]|uniref:Uncharacterized protein n=1 Tax=Streptomyces longisporus TaxID=1948 RepID=A0ABN3MMU8_STRLO